MEYKFKLSSSTIKNDALKSNDCIFLMIAFLYDKRYESKSYLKEYKDLAKKLYAEDFHRYWIFCYEILTQNELRDKYKALKKANISFIIDKFK
ncbi:hypothetical protein LUD75_01485 [Epilithonimonas sp. JDS]|uniref:hypothetical protein n=1 Tax=Epilithonimonas sp. JDS TaxID=2902797 RepID=UPI001E42FA2F|nr:hypothetical protein [Epilithonimonas sp. JDS]MCD9853360.1 hypothetical protein [Epilithonimonas sp. JDS]